LAPVSGRNGCIYLGVKVFNALPSDIKTEFNNPKKFKVVIQKFLYDILLFLGRMFRPSETLNLDLDTRLPMCTIVCFYTT
jgi:hypothetical protein